MNIKESLQNDRKVLGRCSSVSLEIKEDVVHVAGVVGKIREDTLHKE